jgi:hypothetical protein
MSVDQCSELLLKQDTVELFLKKPLLSKVEDVSRLDRIKFFRGNSLKAIASIKSLFS